MNQPFTPSGSVTVAPSAVQGTIAIPGTGHIMRVCNAGLGNAYLGFYEVGTLAPTLVPTTSMLVPAGAIEMFSVASDTTHAVFVGDSTGTILNLTRGSGA